VIDGEGIWILMFSDIIDLDKQRISKLKQVHDVKRNSLRRLTESPATGSINSAPYLLDGLSNNLNRTYFSKVGCTSFGRMS